MNHEKCSPDKVRLDLMLQPTCFTTSPGVFRVISATNSVQAKKFRFCSHLTRLESDKGGCRQQLSSCYSIKNGRFVVFLIDYFPNLSGGSLQLNAGMSCISRIEFSRTIQSLNLTNQPSNFGGTTVLQAKLNHKNFIFWNWRLSSAEPEMIWRTVVDKC